MLLLASTHIGLHRIALNSGSLMVRSSRNCIKALHLEEEDIMNGCKA